jgi:hypothetical protein
MSTFTCPVCTKAYQLDPARAGEKFTCTCGQRLKIPAPPVAATVLGRVGPPPVPSDRPDEPTVRCHKCGQRWPESEMIRKGAAAGGWFGSAGGRMTGGATFAVVDVCPECHDRDQAGERSLMTGVFITFGVLGGLVVLFMLIVAISAMLAR